MTVTFEELIDNFSMFDNWEDRYRYIIDLGRKLPRMADDHKTAATRVDGCVSEVWLMVTVDDKGCIVLGADSDAHIVKGLLAILLTLFSHKTAEQILAIDAIACLARLDLDRHISPNRRNGIASVVARVRSIAQKRLAINAMPAADGGR